MCIAVPAKIVEVDEDKNKAKVSVKGNLLVVDTSLVKPKAGDFVLVHAGVALEIVNPETAEEIKGIFDTLEELYKSEA